MSKFCQKCGKELEDNANSCDNCGVDFNNNQKQNTNVVSIIQKRDIAVAVILSIITCGIYGIYWFICLTDDANKASGEDSTSGGIAFFYSLITCGIYFYYWNYKMGKKLNQAGKMHGKDIMDNSVLYLVLSLFGFSIISYCLMQNDLNTLAE